jgi:predicted ribosomally synthesized peptide with SipW-like signal peptide
MSDDSGRSVSLTRRRVLGGFVTIGAASAAAGAGTMALFRDAETSDRATLSAGTLDLEVGSGFTTAVLQVSPVKPGESDTARGAAIDNAGTIDGSLDVALDAVESRERGLTEPESKSPAEDGDPNGEGELDENLRLAVYLQFEDGSSNPRTEYLIGGPNTRPLVADLDPGVVREDVALDAGEYARVYTDYEVLNAGNEIQSDEVELRLTFELNQKDSQ